MILNQRYSFGEMEDDLRITVNHETGTAHVINGRISPFKFGIYLSAYFTCLSEAKYTLDAVRISYDSEVGENIYTDSLSAYWNFKDIKTMGMGAGFNHAFDSGISFNLGTDIPITFVKTVDENVTFFPQDDEFAASDAQHEGCDREQSVLCTCSNVFQHWQELLTSISQSHQGIR